jgi:hypothetical protein
VLGIGRAEEDRDVVGVCVPALLCIGECSCVAGLRCGEDVGGEQDVLPQEARELIAGGVAVVGLDRVADVCLVCSSRATAAFRSGRTVLWSGTFISNLMITLRVQVMWSSHSLRIASWNASADELIGA